MKTRSAGCFRRSFALSAAAIVVGSIFGPAAGQTDDTDDLSDYFGFDGLEVIRIGDDSGPMAVADMNGDGLKDIVVVHNRESRLEVHLQLRDPDPSNVKPPRRVNEFPDHWRFERTNVSLVHGVATFVLHDFNDDGLKDIIFTGRPSEIVFMQQTETGDFEMTRRHRRKSVATNRGKLRITDLIGDEKPELVTTIGSTITVFPLDGDNLGTGIELPTAGNASLLLASDFNGDGHDDLAAVLVDDDAPIRLWITSREGDEWTIGAQNRFEMPPLYDAKAIERPGQASLLATIEQQSRRVVIHKLSTDAIETEGDREISLGMRPFTDAESRSREALVVDLDGDGLNDLLATDVESNAVATYRQVREKGLQAGERHPSLSKITMIAAGNVDDDPMAELFVLSQDEEIVGRADIDVRGDAIVIPFPQPLSLTPGKSPAAMTLVASPSGARLAVVQEEKRDYIIDLVAMDGTRETIELGKLSRTPDHVVAFDADQDGREDLLLLSPGKPAMMVRQGETEWETLPAEAMGQEGLLRSAAAKNTTPFDVDGDGRPELIVSDGNFLRALRFDAEPGAGISPGWQVVAQINASDRDAKLGSVTTQGGAIMTVDTANNAILIMRPGETGAWSQTEALTVRGFDIEGLFAGRFAADGMASLLAIGDEGFGVARFGGERVAFEDVDAWQSADEAQVPHEITSGDINGDGIVDMVVLDAGEQMCEVFTFGANGKLLRALGFEVFESRLFGRGSMREFEPNMAVIADVTGDGADDLLLHAHDRILLYPQMTAASASAGE